MSCFIFFWNSCKNFCRCSMSRWACRSSGMDSSVSCSANSTASLSVSEVMSCWSLRSFSMMRLLCKMKSLRFDLEEASMPGRQSSRCSSSSSVRSRSFFTSAWCFRKRSLSSTDSFWISLLRAVLRRCSIRSSMCFFSASLFFLALSSLSLRLACLSRLNLTLSSSPIACASMKLL